MSSVFLLALVAVTSLLSWLLRSRRRPSPVRAVANAVNGTLECIGAAVVFLSLNVALGVAAILAARALSGGFVSLYLVSDTTLLALSFLQAVAFHSWRHGP